MIVDKEQYKEIVSDISEYAKGQISDDELKKFVQHVEEKLKNFVPTFMIYGTYNAGKSTLVNALFGKEEMAKTGDAPETYEVTSYNYNGYTIYDTPGINAPIEHEKITQEHLNKCEIVLFMMSNDGSLEEEYVYNKISEIVKVKKPLLIVLNNKKGTEPNSKELIAQIDKVNINLSKIGDKNGIKNIESLVTLCVVDAKTALEGKVENEEELIDESNIIQLEREIKNLLESAGNKEVINALNLYIQNFVEKIIVQIDTKIQNPELKKVEELLTYLEKLKQNSQIELNNIIHKKTMLLESGLKERLSNRSSETELNNYLQENIDEIINQIEKKIEKISIELKSKIENFSNEMNAISLNHQNINSIRNDENIENNSSKIADSMKSILKNKDLVAKVTTEALLQSKKIFTELLKGKGPVKLGKFANKFAIALNVAITAYDIYQSVAQHDKEVEKQRQNALSIANTSKEVAQNLKEAILSQIESILDDIFSPLLKDFQEMSKKLDSNKTLFLENKTRLQTILSETKPKFV